MSKRFIAFRKSIKEGPDFREVVQGYFVVLHDPKRLKNPLHAKHSIGGGDLLSLAKLWANERYMDKNKIGYEDGDCLTTIPAREVYRGLESHPTAKPRTILDPLSAEELLQLDLAYYRAWQIIS
jgi:hypothetical protein